MVVVIDRSVSVCSVLLLLVVVIVMVMVMMVHWAGGGRIILLMMRHALSLTARAGGRREDQLATRYWKDGAIPQLTLKQV